jgi:hypothetical protein
MARQFSFHARDALTFEQYQSLAFDRLSLPDECRDRHREQGDRHHERLQQQQRLVIVARREWT